MISWFQNLKLQYKIFFCYIIASIIPIIALGFFSYNQSRSLLLEQASTEISANLTQCSLKLQSQLDIYNNILKYITLNKDIINATTYNYNNYFEMYEKFSKQVDDNLNIVYYLHDTINRLTIYSGTNVARHYPSILPISEVKDSNWIQILKHNINTDWSNADNGSIFIAQRILTSKIDVPLSALYMEIDPSALFDSCNALSTNPYGIIVVNSHGDILYNKSNLSYSLTLQEVNAMINSNTGDTNYLAFHKKLSQYNWDIYFYQPINYSVKNATRILFATQIFFIITLIINFILVTFLSRLISRPITNLTKNIMLIKENNFTCTLTTNCTDEIGTLITCFNSMINKINTLITEVYLIKIAQRDSQIKILKSQINSHFLYNCLSVINMKALTINALDISKMTKLLAAFYRLHLDVDKSHTTVSKEIETIKTYLEIESIRHNNSFDIIFNIDDAILDKKCLNMILQPIVENAIVHGLDNKTTDDIPTIQVSARLERYFLVIKIKDNGCGLSNMQIQKILSTEANGIGIKNVDSRIKLYYGNDFGITIESQIDKGTAVTIKLPNI